MKKALTLAVVLLSVLALVLTGCGRLIGGTDSSDAEGKNGRVTIDFWTFWGSEIRRPVIEKIVKDFNESQDKIHVKHTFLPFGDIWTKEKAAIAAGNPPDVVISDINTIRLRAKKGQLESLAPYMKDDPSMKERFLPQAWNAVEYEDQAYALPFNLDTRILFYNKKLFKEAGLNPDRPPETWDELDRYADKLSVKKGDGYDRIGFHPAAHGGVGPEVWMINADGKNFFDDKEKPIIDNPEDVEALEWIKGFNEKYGLKNVNAFKAQFGNQQSHPFLNEKVAIHVDAPTFYTQIRDYGKGIDFGVAPLPERKPGTGHTSWSGGFAAEVPKGSKHPKEAYEFIQYLTDKQAQSYWGEKNFDNVANVEANDMVLDELSGDEKMVYQMAVDNLKQSLVTPTPIAAPDYPNVIKPELDKALQGSKFPDKALQDAQKSVEKLIQSNQ